MHTPKSSLLLSSAFLFFGLPDACRAAGDVTVVAVTAFPPTLEITGDGEDNALAVYGDGTGAIGVIGLSDESPGASDQGTITTVNGASDPLVFPDGAFVFAPEIQIRTGDGDDAVRVECVGSVFINAGTGNNTVVARDVSGLLGVGNYGDANDSLSVLIERLTGGLHLTTGAGPDTVILRDVDTIFDIMGDTGPGNDRIVLDSVFINSSYSYSTFWTGPGNDWFQILGDNTLASFGVLLEEGADLLDLRLGTLEISPLSTLHGGSGHDTLLGADNLLADPTSIISLERVED